MTTTRVLFMRPMTHRKPIASSVALFLLLIPLLAAGEKKNWAPASTPVPIIELRGDGNEIGAEYAKALGPQVKSLQGYLDRYLQNDAQRAKAMAAAVFFEATLD